MKKILILAMSCNQELFQNQEKMLREELYAKDILDNKFENVDFWSYTASTDNKYHVNKKLHRLEVPVDDSIRGTYEKTVKTFNLLKQLRIEFDYIFRTNCSTYVNAELLRDFVEIIDDKKIYSGSIYCSNNGTGPYEWCLYGIGNSLLLSKFWIDVICDNPVEKYKKYNKVTNPEETYYHVDDNTFGFVINCYCLEHGIDMYSVWNNFRMPVVNTIPSDPYSYIAVPFRQYNKEGTRENERMFALTIHESIKQHNVNIDPKIHTAVQDFHIIDYTRKMHSIVSREFGEQFLNVMAYPRFINKLKQTYKL